MNIDIDNDKIKIDFCKTNPTDIKCGCLNKIKKKDDICIVTECFDDKTYYVTSLIKLQQLNYCDSEKYEIDIDEIIVDKTINLINKKNDFVIENSYDFFYDTYNYSPAFYFDKNIFLFFLFIFSILFVFLKN